MKFEIKFNQNQIKRTLINKSRIITNRPISNHSCIKEQRCEEEKNRIALIGIEIMNIKASKSYSIREQKSLKLI